MDNSQPAPCAWADNLRPGTIVLFRFPERHDGLAGKRRPCLVLGSRQGPTGLHIALAYGTSAKTAANRGFDLRIISDRDCQSAGLARPSRFVLARRITVPANDPRFDSGMQDSPIIGKLPGHHMTELSALSEGIGDRIFDDQIAGPNRHNASRRCELAPQNPTGSVISPRREIVAPARRSRRDRNRSSRTILVEHRRKRVPRPTPSAA